MSSTIPLKTANHKDKTNSGNENITDLESIS